MKTQTQQIVNKIKKLREKGVKVDIMGSYYKVIRKQRAERFITKNHPDVSQSKRQSFIKVLCEYEQFLNTETK